VLVLSRKKDEIIDMRFHGIDATIQVIEIRGDKVRLGINAPDDVTIHRREVTIQIENSGDCSEQSDVPGTAVA